MIRNDDGGNFLATAWRSDPRNIERFGGRARHHRPASNNSCIPTSLIPAPTLGIGGALAIPLVAVALQGLPGAHAVREPRAIWGSLIGAVMATFSISS
jgi:TctA family transporter